MTTEPAGNRYITSPWQLREGEWWEVARRVVSHIQEHRLLLTAAGVSFYGFLSLFPAIASMVFLYGLLTDSGGLEAHLSILSQVLPPGAVNIISDRLEDLVKSSNSPEVGLGLLLSLALSFWSASRGVAALVDVIGVAYRQPDTRSFLRSALVSLVLTLGMIVMLIMTLSAIAGIPALTKLLNMPSIFEQLILIARWPVMIAAVAASLFALYRLAPDRRMAKWSWIAPGVLFATAVWAGMSALFSFYVESFGNYEATFGALTSIVILMLWMNYSVLIIAIGAELNAELEFTTKIDTTVSPSMPMGYRGATVADDIKPL
jgi:membrane protein